MRLANGGARMNISEKLQDCLEGHCGARAMHGRRANLFGTRGSVKDVVGRSLRLCGSLNQKLAIIAQLLEPRGAG
jgi:hypothetical protein